MKDFEARQRELFRSHLKTNIAAFSASSSATMTILSTRQLIGRLDAQQIAASLRDARQPAWATISVNLHNQLQQLVKEATSYLGTQHAVTVPFDLSNIVDAEHLGLTLPRWIALTESLEHQRVIKALRGGYGLNLTPIESFSRATPYSLSNSGVSGITVTTATSVMNRVAMRIFELAGITHYRLDTEGDRRNKLDYEQDFPVEPEPRSPSFIGDRSYPLPA